MEGKGKKSGCSLAVIESVRCLECGAVYAKPAGGGTARANPGCPDCGYVGWLSGSVPAGGRGGVVGAVGAEEERGRHEAGPPRAGNGRAADEVGLAEHAVEVGEEAGEEVARAEAEARGQDTRVPVGVDRHEVGRVA